MKVDIQTRGFRTPAAQGDYVRRRVRYIVGSRSDSIKAVMVRLGGTNGGHGGADMFCLMQVHLAESFIATVVHMGSDIHDVINRAADRLSRVVTAYLAQAQRARLAIGRAPEVAR
ncbi:MAG: hypothetical protein ABI409_21225 [Ramlibacter sp.]